MSKPTGTMEFTRVKTRGMKNQVIFVHMNVSVSMEQLEGFARSLKESTGAKQVVVLPKGLRATAMSSTEAHMKIVGLLKSLKREIKKG